ncbi:hypothetical protein [Photobacterium lutimaris]|nr:hypothetical protein [Photobacterium lutimaris]TDR74444.1 hypothetical protein DFP78_10731 [Photobacterium lutimaris]
MEKSISLLLFLITRYPLTSRAAFAGDYRIGFGVSQFEALGSVNTERLYS